MVMVMVMVVVCDGDCDGQWWIRYENETEIANYSHCLTV